MPERERVMSKRVYGMYCAVIVSLMLCAPAVAEEGIIEGFLKGCEKELTTYCKDVTPGGGRLLACLYAHQDKLSGRCEYALYDSAVKLERVVAALTYVANECRDDLKAYCADVKPGEGRLLECLDKNDAKVTGRCKQAIQDVGLKE